MSTGASAPAASSPAAHRAWTSRSRSPGRQELRAPCSAAAVSRPRSARSSRSPADSASRIAISSSLASSPNAGWPSAPSRAAGAPASRSAARTKALGSCQGTASISAKPWAPGPYSSRIRSASTFVVTSAAPPVVKTAQTRSTAAVRSTGGATPPHAHATAAGPVSTRPAGCPGPPSASQAPIRPAAAWARATLRFQRSVIPNAVA